MKVKRKSSDEMEQIHIEDIKLNTGDILYKDGKEYAEVVGWSDTLYFVKRLNQDGLASPYHRDRLIDLILSGHFTLNQVNF